MVSPGSIVNVSGIKILDWKIWTSIIVAWASWELDKIRMDATKSTKSFFSNYGFPSRILILESKSEMVWLVICPVTSKSPITTVDPCKVIVITAYALVTPTRRIANNTKYGIFVRLMPLCQLE